MLTDDQQSALYALRNGLAIDEEMSHALYVRGLCEQKTVLEEDGSVSRIGWSISSDGLRWIEHIEEQKKQHNRQTIRFWISTVIQLMIALAAICSLLSKG